MNIYKIITVIIIILILFILFIIRFISKRRRKNQNINIPNIRSDSYKSTIYNNTPIEYKNALDYLYSRIDHLDSIIKVNEKSLELKSNRAINDVLLQAGDAERKIRQYWENSKKKADFYYFIGLHYASFTLADKLTQELNTLRKINNILSETIYKTQSKIDTLKNEMHSSRNIAQIKREHQELCKKCDALRKTRKISKEQIKNCSKRRDNQNIITGKRRDYIGTHFGRRGRMWRKRIISKSHSNR